MLKSSILLLTSLLLLTGCDSQQRQAEKHDQQLRQQVEQLKKKSKAMPMHGSDTNHYIP